MKASFSVSQPAFCLLFCSQNVAFGQANHPTRTLPFSSQFVFRSESTSCFDQASLLNFIPTCFCAVDAPPDALSVMPSATGCPCYFSTVSFTFEVDEQCRGSLDRQWSWVALEIVKAREGLLCKSSIPLPAFNYQRFGRIWKQSGASECISRSCFDCQEIQCR